MRTFVTNVNAPIARPSVLWDLSSDERYKHPGTPVYRVRPDGQALVRMDGDAIFLIGGGASPDGNRPFLDRLDLQTRVSTRLFRSAKDALEYPLTITDPAARTILSWHQSPMDPPNAFVRTLGDASPAAVPAGEASVASSARAVTRLGSALASPTAGLPERAVTIPTSGRRVCASTMTGRAARSSTAWASTD